MIIDTHCHIDMMPNPEAYIRQKDMEGEILIGMTNLPSHFQMGQPHIRGYKHIRLSLGLHPLRANEGLKQIALFRSLVNQTSYIGEIGLDFSRDGYTTREVQLSAFREVMTTIQSKKKIVSVHSRRAEKEVLSLLCEYEIKNVIFHWYSGPVSLIPEIIKQGYYFSVNEAMCLSKNGMAIMERIPQERVLTETDAPYNEKTNIGKVLEWLSCCWHISYQDAEVVVERNFRRLLKEIKIKGNVDCGTRRY